MTYSYTGVLEHTHGRRFRLFERAQPGSGEAEAEAPFPSPEGDHETGIESGGGEKLELAQVGLPDPTVRDEPSPPSTSSDPEVEAHGRMMELKRYTTSNLGITLTLMSIVIAFSVSLIVMMGLISDNCGSCTRAAQDPSGGGLAGRWWRFWAGANDKSGFIGAGIVGSFIVAASGFYVVKALVNRTKRRAAKNLKEGIEPGDEKEGSTQVYRDTKSAVSDV